MHASHHWCVWNLKALRTASTRCGRCVVKQAARKNTSCFEPVTSQRFSHTKHSDALPPSVLGDEYLPCNALPPRLPGVAIVVLTGAGSLRYPPDRKARNTKPKPTIFIRLPKMCNGIAEFAPSAQVLAIIPDWNVVVVRRCVEVLVGQTPTQMIQQW